MTTIINEHLAGVARSCMLVDLRISTFSGRRKDKATESDVQLAKNAASAKATSIHKNLFADCQELDAINKHVSVYRNKHYSLTLPWDDAGQRLLPAKAMLKYNEVMREGEEEFQRLVRRFLGRYDTLVAAAGFRLGDLFNRAEYPTMIQAARRFKWGTEFFPVPVSGDFRLDVESEVQRELAENLEATINRRVGDSVGDAYRRLHEVLKHMSERMEETDSTKRFRSNMLETALDTLDSLKYLNILGDTKLEAVRDEMVATLRSTSMESIRTRPEHRTHVKARVDDLLEQLDWSIDDDTDEVDPAFTISDAADTTDAQYGPAQPATTSHRP